MPFKMNTGTISEIGEFGLIQIIQSIIGTPTKEVLVGLGDDAATFQPQNKPIVVSTDAMVEDVHFRLDWTTAEHLAHKALASSLSDLAAKAAQPAHAVIALGLPSHTRIDWMEAFYRSIAANTKLWQTQIIGGDTVASEKLWITITVWGYQTTPNPIGIHTANPGDKILVSGYLGDAAGGLHLLQSGQIDHSAYHQYLINRFSCPSPRIAEAVQIVEGVTPSTMTDISDGISRDLRKVCEASNVGARLEAKRLPISAALQDVFEDEVANIAWQGGEDYELLMTLSPDDSKTLFNKWDQSVCPLTMIGEIKNPDYGIEVEGLKNVEGKGFDHFKK